MAVPYSRIHSWLRVIMILAVAIRATVSLSAEALSQPAAQFAGKIAVSAKDSVPEWPESIQAPPAAPNIVLIILDDVGFGDTGTFGGPVATPTLDRLAAEGLRYNRFHTAAICSPTRAALLSGRNHHRMGYGEFGGVGYPGYNGLWKKSTVSIAEVLKRYGYSTAAFGKWHNTPYQDITPIGPFDRWPTGLGFEYFYGNLMGASSQWEPALWRNTERVPPPARPDQQYHFTTDITDEAIRWVQTRQSLAREKPYFLYFATEAAHGPHHVPKAWIERYRGHFDQGWDKLREETFARQKKLGVVPAHAVLTPRPKELPAWSSMPADAKRLLARQMEVFAAFVAHTDHEIGRLVQVVKAAPQGENTLILFIVGDNGPEAAGGVRGTYNLMAGADRSIQDQLPHLDELGGPLHTNYYAAAWGWTGSTPFQWTKYVASHFGGTRNPLVVSWPARIKDQRGLRSQFTHVNDVAATLYDVVGIQLPEVVDGVKQLPLDGVSFAASFEREDAPSQHRVQYFEAMGNRAIYQDGWMAAARHFVPWYGDLWSRNTDFEHDRWELYRIEEDFSQAHDLAARYPAKLKALQSLFDTEARKNDVYPLGAGTGIRPPPWSKDKREFTYHAEFPGLVVGGPDFQSSHRITARVVIPKEGAEGVIVASGTREGGFTLYVKDHRLIYERKRFGVRRDIVTSSERLATGQVELGYEFVRESAQAGLGDIGRLYINGRLVGEATFTREGTPFFGSIDIGQNSPSPVSPAYQPPFKFTGTLENVTVQMK